jgi:hypothetical protein
MNTTVSAKPTHNSNGPKRDPKTGRFLKASVKPAAKPAAVMAKPAAASAVGQKPKKT